MAPGQLTALLAALVAIPADEGGAWLEEPQPGDLIDRFRLVRRIGRGGFGVVFEARDEVLGRLVALKLVRTGRPATLGSERLVMEAEAAARLSHPNIVTLHDVGRCERGPYLVLELLRGESLATRLARGPAPLPEAVRTAGEVARALAHAHRLGVVHRDLKPGNVFLCEDGQVKVLDFGLAHAFGLPRIAGGTPAYMAPEQRTGAPEDERTDVFALGVTLHQLLTGELPFGEDGTLRRPLPAARLAIPEAPELSELVHRMLERDPVRRPRNGTEAVEALARVSASLRPSPPGPARPVRRRRRWPLLLAGVGAGVAAALVLRWLWPVATTPGTAGRMVLAVADVANETGEKELELSGLLRTVLEQSTFLDVLPRGRLVDALPESQAGGPVRLDEAAATAAARGVRAPCVILARLLRLGETYLIEVRAVDPASGTPRFSFKEQDRGKESLGGLLDRVGEKVRLLLGEEPAAIRKSTIPAGLVTSSLEAWRAYTNGLDCFERSFAAESSASCLDEMKRAVAIDPGFALAQLQTSVLLYLSGSPRALQLEALRRAESNPDRVPPHDRGRLAGWGAFLAGRDAEAKALLLAAAESTPDDRIAWYLAGELPYHRDEFGEALPVFQRIHALFPTWAYTTRHLTFSLGVAGRSADLRALARELDGHGDVAGAVSSASYARLWFDPASAVTTCQRAMPREGAEADACLAVALLNLGAREQLDAHLAAMGERERKREPENPRGFSWYMRFMLLGQEGRWLEVERTMKATGDLENAWHHVTSAELVAGAGDPALVGREAMRILELNRGLASNLAVHLAYLGDLRRAAELEGYLPPGSPRVEVYRALVRWRGGDLPGAIEALRAIADKTPVSAAPATPPPLFLLGEALAEAGQDAEAVKVLRRYRAIPMTYPTWFWPRSQWLLARSLDRMGDRDGAREVLSPLLKLWERASEGQPHLQEARALGQRLGLS